LIVSRQSTVQPKLRPQNIFLVTNLGWERIARSVLILFFKTYGSMALAIGEVTLAM